MKRITRKSALILTVSLGTVFAGCNTKSDQKMTESSVDTTSAVAQQNDDFEYLSETFADIKIIRYRIPDFDKLTLQQKKLAYYLYQASLSGRDIIWDQNYKHNLAIRNALEHVVKHYDGDKATEDWSNFMEYTKRVWFSNGIHHHYSTAKFLPNFEKAYFQQLLKETETSVSKEVMEAMFNPEVDAKRVNKADGADWILESANNFYDDGISTKEVEAFYAERIDTNDPKPVSYGLNSKLVKKDGTLKEEVYHINGRYGKAIAQIVHWLEKAKTVAESDAQAKGFELLIEYYKTGDLRTWDEYSIQWVETTGDILDYINGFIEVYGDAIGYRASYESIIQMKDFEASKRMQKMQDNVQWFEDNSSIAENHKKEKVTGVTYNVVNVIVESGDASPSTPIGVNLPNANWIRSEHGSKSVSLGNIVEAYEQAGGESLLQEFCYTEEEFQRSKAHGKLASKLHTALHEVVGHASGKLEPGVRTTKETMKNYASTIEEGRADLVALYFILDPKMIELGLMETLEVGKAEYDGYIRNGLMTQLQRIEKGEVIEEDHMRNRQMITQWVYERGKDQNVIEKRVKDGKTYFVINDYKALRELFGELLKEVQRIKSQGDFDAAKQLVENYGVQVNAEIHAEVLSRVEKLNIPPYGGFINPRLVPIEQDGEITDIVVEYPNDFSNQMLKYADKYSFLIGKGY